MVTTIQAKFSDKFTPLVISTGQHQDALDDVFQLFNIRPNITLTMDRSSNWLSSLQGQLIQALEGGVNGVHEVGNTAMAYAT